MAGFGCSGTVTDPEPTTAELIESVCQAGCACLQCSASEMSDCRKGNTRDQALAVEAHCDGLWRDYFECLDEHMVCDAGQLYPGQCSGLLVERDKCVEEWQAANPTCDDFWGDLVVPYEMCGQPIPPKPEVCTDAAKAQLQCQVECVKGLSDCAALSGEDAAAKKALDDCLAACPS